MTDESQTAINRNLLCRWFGHKIEYVPWRYEPSTTVALIGGERLDVPVTFACCEICSRCGMEIWTPW